MFFLQVTNTVTQQAPNYIPIIALIIGLIVNVIGIGVFIGVVRSALADFKEDISAIKKDMTTHSEEISNLRERMAVQEYVTRGITGK